MAVSRSHELALLTGALLLLGACAFVPAGPSTTAPREGRTTSTEFRSDDQMCRGWVGRRILDEDALSMPASASDSLQSRYDAAYLGCMSAEQTPSARDAFTPFVPAPPSVTPPEIAAPAFAFPPITPPTPAGDQSAPLSIASPSGVAPF
jgi:hypothetical protein